MATLATFARIVHVLVLSLWAGAAAFVLLFLAPEVLGSLGHHAEGVNLLGAAMDRLDLFGLIGGPVAIATLLMGWIPLGSKVRLRAFGLLLMILAAALGAYWLRPEIPHLSIDLSDPFVDRLSSLSTLSFGLLAMHVVVALGILAGAVIGTYKVKRGITVEI